MKPRPALRTGQAVFPHPALQKGSFSVRLQFPAMSVFQAEKPKLVKIGVRPSLMIKAAASPFSASVFAQNAAQAHANPFVHGLEDAPMAVLEVLEPAPQGRVDTGDYCRQALALRPASFRADRVLELVHALLARPFQTSLEVVAQKVEPAFFPPIHDARLGRMNP